MRKLTPKDIEIARLMSRGMTDTKIGELVGIRRENVTRRKKRPEIQAYLAKLAKGTDAEFEAQIKKAAKEEVARLPIIWDRIESAKRKLAIADDPEARDSDKLVAIRALDEMHGILRVQEPNPGETMPEAPDVYQASWMRKPQ